MSNRTPITTAQAPAPLFFRHVSEGPRDSKLLFRLIHFWEARNNSRYTNGGILLGVEMLMIDEEGTVAKGFIPKNRLNLYQNDLKSGCIYTLTNFFASDKNVLYGVADQKLVICFTHTSVLSKLQENSHAILSERFRFHSIADFEANCDLRGDLHDVVGHLKLVDGQPLHQRPVLSTKVGSASRKILVHLQLKE